MKHTIAIIERTGMFGETLKMGIDYSGAFGKCASFTHFDMFTASAYLQPALLILGACQQKYFEHYKQQWPSAKKILIIENETDMEVLNTMAAGCSACIVKGSVPQTYLSLIQKVLNDEIVMSESAIKALLAHYQHSNVPHQLFSMLSAREYEVLQHLAKGLINKEIAACLHISHETVRRHCFNIYRKLNVSNRSEAIGLLLRSH